MAEGSCLCALYHAVYPHLYDTLLIHLFPFPVENQDCVISFESQACTRPKLPEEDDLVLATCPHLNGSLKTAGPTGRGETSKWKLAYQGSVGNDVIHLSALSPCNEEWDHGFPLPATELGATVLVTTKTIQNSFPNEERP